MTKHLGHIRRVARQDRSPRTDIEEKRKSSTVEPKSASGWSEGYQQNFGADERAQRVLTVLECRFVVEAVTFQDLSQPGPADDGDGAPHSTRACDGSDILLVMAAADELDITITVSQVTAGFELDELRAERLTRVGECRTLDEVCSLVTRRIFQVPARRGFASSVRAAA